MKALLSTISALFGMLIGVGASHPEALYYWVHLKYIQGPIIAIFAVSLIILERLFKNYASKIIASTWAAAFCSYLTVPATKLLVKDPFSAEQIKMYAVVFSLGSCVSWYLFYRSHKFVKKNL
jgi:hypothetical protein